MLKTVRRTVVPMLVLAALLTAPGCGSKKNQPSRPQPSPTELYQEAEGFMTARKYVKALNRYEKIDTARQPELRAQVHLRMADAYFAQKNILALTEAQARYRSFLNFFPLSDQAPYAQYRYAMCLKRQINRPERDQTTTRRAIEEFEKIRQLYPNSTWVVEARERLDELEDHLSRDSYLKARFYYSRKAYSSAIARLQEIVAENPDFESIDEVYVYLGLSFLKGKVPDQARVYFQKVLAEYPDSRYAKKAAQGLAKARKQIATASPVPAG